MCVRESVRERVCVWMNHDRNVSLMCGSLQCVSGLAHRAAVGGDPAVVKLALIVLSLPYPLDRHLLIRTILSNRIAGHPPTCKFGSESRRISSERKMKVGL